MIRVDILEQLARNTIRIECSDNTYGTGFFFNFSISENNNVPTIITNRHVMENVESIKLIFSLNDYFTSAERHVEKQIIEYNNVQAQVVYHSDPNIDLCAIKISPIIHLQIQNSIEFQFKSLNMSNVPTDEELEALRFMEDIIMIGYPNGVQDSKNNFPIFRRGSTATHPGIDYEGNPECVIDMTVTPGSSGSPVFIYNPFGFNTRGGISLEERLIFLGVNRAVYTINNVGEIIEIESPTKLATKSRIGINLGLIIKAKAIRDIERQILETINEVIENENKN